MTGCRHVSRLDAWDGLRCPCRPQAAPSSRGEAARRGGRWLLAVVLLLAIAAGLIGCALLGERMRCDRLAATGSGALVAQYGCEAGR